MEWRKLACPDQYLVPASSRRKVVSGLGLVLFVSFFILSVVFMNVSFKASLLNPVLQGFNAYFSKGTGLDCGNNTSVCGNDSSRLDHVMVLNGSLYSNASRNGEESVELPGSGNGTLSGNVSENGNLNVSRNGEKSSDFADYGSKGQILGDVNGTLSKNVSSGSNFGDKNGVFGESHVEDGNFNVSINGESDSGSKGLNLGDKNGVFGESHVEDGDFNVSSNGGSDSGSQGLNFGDKNGVFGESHVENGDFNVSSNGESDSDSKGQKLGDKNGAFGDFNVSSEVPKSVKNEFRDCDIYDGRWVRDESKPFYPPGSCPHVDRDFDCFLNKRPDDEYVKWRWQPNNCDIPSLNATDFLERLRGQKLVFVGDSLNRNMWESLVCILRHSIPDKTRVHEISGRTEFKKKGFYAFRFEDYNCTVDFVSSPFLVLESSFNGKNGSFDTLRLDVMDKTTTMYHDADVLIFNTGHWWTHEKTSRGEDYYQEGDHVYKTLKVLDAYNRALGTWARWVDDNIDHEKTQVIFRGYSETHFRGGPWNNGGQCHKETEPFLTETHLTKYSSKMRALERVVHEMKYPPVYMNITRLTDYRKDGHPSIYRKEYKTEEEKLAGVHSQDCSHWCLPGVPDTWNELLYASLLKAGRGSWRL